MKKQIFVNCAITYALLFCLLSVLTGCRTNITEIKQTGYFFDTAVTIKLYESGGRPLLSDSAPEKYKKATSEEILSECFEACAVYEQIFSRTVEGSDVWNLNHSEGALLEVEPETVILVRDCLELSERTGGVFDITIAPVSDKWGFSSDNIDSGKLTSPPDKADIEQLVKHVDYRALEVVDDTHLKLNDPEAAIDLGASAKGYIADLLKEKLVAAGVESAIIDLGGNILCIGKKPDGALFNLGIETPFGGNPPIGNARSDKSGVFTTVRTEDKSLVTSGTYHRYFVYEGKLYHHLLNSKTGYPEENGLCSVSILCDSSRKADMYSTTCFLLGLEKGLDLAEKTPGIEALFIDNDYNVSKTSGWPDE